MTLYRSLRPHDPELTAGQAEARWRELLSQSHIRVVVAESAGSLASTCMIALVTNLAARRSRAAIGNR